MPEPQRSYIDFASGDQTAYDNDLADYQVLTRWLSANGAAYGLPSNLHQLDEFGRETLMGIYQGATGVSTIRLGQYNDAQALTCSVLLEQVILTPTSFSPPPPLTLPRLTVTLSPSPGLNKTTTNFLALLTDSKSLVSKRSPHPPLRYQGCPVHRIEEGFVAQGGDVTRGDGSGGESICKCPAITPKSRVQS